MSEPDKGAKMIRNKKNHWKKSHHRKIVNKTSPDVDEQVFEHDQDRDTTILIVNVHNKFLVDMKTSKIQNRTILLRQIWKSIILEINLQESGQTKLHSFDRNFINSESKIRNGLHL